MVNKQFKIVNFSLLLYILYGIGCLFISIYYSVPNVEDFELSVAPQRIGEVDAIVNLLSFYDSRYTTNVFQSFNVLTINKPTWFFIMPLTALLFFTVSFAFLLKTVIKTDKVINFIGLTLIFITSYYLIIPSLPVGLYYMSATYNYIYGFVFYFIWLGIFIRILQGNVSYFGFKGFFLVFSLVLSFGCSELFIVVNGVSLGLLFLHSVWQKNFVHIKMIIPVSILALSCIWFIVSCPSNKFASDSIIGSLADRYPNTPFWLHALKQYGFLWVKSFINPILISVALLLAFLYQQKIIGLKGVSRKMAFILFVGLNVFSYLLSLVFYFGDGGEMETGTPHILNVCLVFALVANLIFLPKLLTFRLKRVAYIIGVGLFLSFLFYPNNYKDMWKEWRNGSFSNLKTAYLRFYKDAEKVKESGTRPTILEFKNYDSNVQTIIFVDDLLPNRENEDWNIALELYFEVDEVRLPGDTKFKER